MRWRHARDFVGLLLIPVLVAAALIAPAWVNMEADHHTKQLACQNAYLNRVELLALKQIGKEIGIPASFAIPPMPAQCDEFSPFEVHSAIFAQHPECTEVGTAEDDMRTTGDGNDVLCLFGGSDYGHTNGGRDVLMGGTGHDALVGGHGWDRLRAGTGDDFLFSIDGMANDVLRGAGGEDRCFVDPGDTAYGCEDLHLSNDPAVLEALLRVTYDALSLGEDAQSLLASAPACGRENPPEWCG